jgi:hypothetical protein
MNFKLTNPKISPNLKFSFIKLAHHSTLYTTTLLPFAPDGELSLKSRYNWQEESEGMQKFPEHIPHRTDLGSQ